MKPLPEATPGSKNKPGCERSGPTLSIPVADAHCHVNPVRGMGARALARKFKEAGGWFLCLVSLPPGHYGVRGLCFDEYRRAIEMHIAECRKAREEGIRVACIAGLHPAEVVRLVTQRGFEEGLRIAYRVVDYVAELCRKGLCDGIGEVGRPHYSCSPVGVVASELVTVRALERAEEVDALVHLHLEQGGTVTVESLELLLRLSGCRRERVLIHHARGSTLHAALAHKVWATVPGTEKCLSEASRLEPGFMVESDFLDDPSRPGVVVYPWLMAENLRGLVENGAWSEETLYRVCVDNVCKFYGVEPP